MDVCGESISRRPTNESQRSMRSDSTIDGRGPGGFALVSLAVVCLSVVALAVAGAGSAAALDGGTGVATAPGDDRVAALGDDDEREVEDEDDEDVPSLIGDWWGIDDDEGAFLGLVQLGAIVLVVGAGGYAANKRYSFVPVQYRRYTLQVHEWLMLIGTALVAPHFLFADELEGLGLFLGILLGVEVLSGFYGRHLHRRVIRLSRGDEAPAVVGQVLETTNERLFSQWRRIHVGLVSITALALLVHIVSAA